MSQARTTPSTRSGVHRFAGPPAEADLVCFMHAGGLPTVYQPWVADVGDRYTVWVATVRHRDLPGAGRDLWAEYARRQADALGGIEGPLTLYGHSMGAVSAYETARELLGRGREVVHLVVSGRDAPHLPTTVELPEDTAELVRAVADRYGGVPEILLEDPELARVFGEDMRADFEALAAYVWPSGPPLDIPITVAAGVDDPVVTDEGLRAWAEHTTGPFRLERLPGGHFFDDAERSALLALLD
ncbi:thioesterase [Thermobifida halotolerans]|uniref:Thioesterase n=1 Tax=Thermobifida halotolerans TaxID=483545 RepID=A0A399FW70_9ACTN|nr:thioesterase domain-containing protein [Thermobifida halotolerans]UOE18033.1 thioesterase [Thermobifida halotolerans]